MAEIAESPASRRGLSGETRGAWEPLRRDRHDRTDEPTLSPMSMGSGLPHMAPSDPQSRRVGSAVDVLNSRVPGRNCDHANQNSGIKISGFNCVPFSGPFTARPYAFHVE